MILCYAALVGDNERDRDPRYSLQNRLTKHL